MMIDINMLLAWGATYKQVAKGSIIFNEGTACSFYYQLVSGQARWVNISDEGKECIHTVIEPGESFGELPLFDNEPYAATAIADQDLVLIRLHKPIFIQLLKENQDIHFKFSELLVQRLRFKFILIEALSSQDPENRITALIQYLKKENKNFCSECHQLKLTRQQIANMTGLRVETVIRSIKHMHDKGELEVRNGKVFC